MGRFICLRVILWFVFSMQKIFKLTTEPCKHVALGLNNCGRVLGCELIIAKKFIKSRYNFAFSARSWTNIFQVKLISNHLFPKVLPLLGDFWRVSWVHKGIQSWELQKISHPSWTKRRRMWINRSWPCGYNSITHNPVRPLYRLHLTN